MILAEDVEGCGVVQLEGGVDGERLVPRVVGQKEVGRYVPSIESIGLKTNTI